MTTPLLQLKAVSKSYGAVRALHEVSFALHAGEVHALLGENGAGKSTLIKIITGAIQADCGSMELDGMPVRHLTPARARALGVACIYQQPALFPDLTVAENIGLRLEPANACRRVPWRRRQERARELLEGIGARISSGVEARQLSMPEQQLVEIACAMGTGVRLVIMDEPTASLTRAEQALLFEAVRRLKHQGVGVVYISHRLEEIFKLADRVTVLRDGENAGTFPVKAASGAAGDRALTESELIRLMVGREVSDIYPAAAGAHGEVVLAAKGLGCAAAGVRDVTLDLRAGEIVGLAGLVGAGRTELAGVLFGLTPADAGELRLEGRPVRVDSPAAAIELGIACVPEDRRRHGVILDMSIANNISMAIHPRLFPGSWIRTDAERELALEWMRELGVRGGGPDAAGGTLSGGNQQKVSLARWLATRPKVLILDEPTQGVDVGAKSQIHAIIRRLASEGMAVLMISSDLPEIVGMSDRIAVMRGGTIRAVLPGGADPHDVMAAALGQGGVQNHGGEGRAES